MSTEDRIAGCLLGLAWGDALGAPFEGGPLERMVWRLLGRTRQREIRFTDDTQMTIDLVECLLTHGRVEQQDLADRFAHSYRWSRGYGPAAARLLKKIRRGARWQDVNCAKFVDGSYGNGGAMRSAILGVVFANDPQRLKMEVTRATEITHAHPLAIEGAVLIATAAAILSRPLSSRNVLAQVEPVCKTAEFKAKLDLAHSQWTAEQTPPPRAIAKVLGNGIAAVESCVTAVYLAQRFLDQPFGDLLQFTRKMRGDVDTVSAMAGSLWGTCRGAAALNPPKKRPLEQHDRLCQLARQLAKKFAASASQPTNLTTT